MRRFAPVFAHAAGSTATSEGSLDAVFMALADPTRRAILARLAEGEATVNELVEPFALSQPAISKHLKVLERAGLVAGGREAQRRPRRLEAAPLGAAVDWLERYRAFWETRYARLDGVLAALVADEKRPRRRKDQGSSPPNPSPSLPRRRPEGREGRREDVPGKARNAGQTTPQPPSPRSRSHQRKGDAP